MRQIKFRGYNRKREMWLNGSYILNRGHHFIAPDEFAEGKTWEDYEVEEDSIGQFTGVCDCDLEPIYEGDLLISLMLGETFEVVYEARGFVSRMKISGHYSSMIPSSGKSWATSMTASKRKEAKNEDT